MPSGNESSQITPETTSSENESSKLTPEISKLKSGTISSIHIFRETFINRHNIRNHGRTATLIAKINNDEIRDLSDKLIQSKNLVQYTIKLIKEMDKYKLLSINRTKFFQNCTVSYSFFLSALT